MSSSCVAIADVARALGVQDAEYAENLARMDAIKAQLGRTSYEVTYARAFGKVRAWVLRSGA